LSVKLRLQILVILIAACTIIYVHLFVPGPGNGADFVAFYAGAYADAQGLDPFDQATLWQTEKTLYLGGASYHGPMQLDRYLNPPPFALLLQPLTHLPPSTAYWIWVASMFVSAGLGAYLCLVQWPRGPRLLGTAIVACCPAALWDYRLGQNAMLLLPSLGLAFWARSRQRPVLAGLALSGGLVKPQLLLPIALLVILTSPRQERIAIPLRNRVVYARQRLPQFFAGVRH